MPEHSTSVRDRVSSHRNACSINNGMQNKNSLENYKIYS